MTPILALEQVSKQYPGVVALDRVDFNLEQGEVRALLGKNGAGKSTLVKILSGAVHPDSGTIRIDGQPVTIADPQDAFEQGICTVYQEMSLVPGLTVAENILLGRWPHRRRAGPVRHQPLKGPADRQGRARPTRSLDQSGRGGWPAQRGTTATDRNRQGASRCSPRVLVLDEPTSALASGEVDVLHRVVRRLAEQGQAIIYVTHRLQEIPHVADSVTVLRDGRLIGTITAQEATPARIAKMMIGSDWQRTEWGGQTQVGEVKLAVQKPEPRRGAERHFVRGARRRGARARRPAGLGPHRARARHFRAGPGGRGEIYVKGERVSHPTPENMKTHGVGLTPEDRKRQGLVLPFSVRDNLTMASMDRFSVSGVLQRSRASEMAADDGRVHGNQDAGAAGGRADVERRQPTESRRRQLAEHPARSAADGRADTRH